MYYYILGVVCGANSLVYIILSVHINCIFSVWLHLIALALFIHDLSSVSVYKM